jgi:hypothetical protein
VEKLQIEYNCHSEIHPGDVKKNFKTT